MRRQITLWMGVATVGVLVLWAFFHRPSSSQPSASSPSPAPATKSSSPLTITLPADAAIPASATASTTRSGIRGGSPSSSDRPPTSPTEAGPRLGRLPTNDLPLVKVNGVALTASQIFPPGTLQPGDELPQLTLDKFVEDAVERVLLVQEAERRGFSQDPAFLQYMEETRQDIEEFPNLTPEQRVWQFEELRAMALMHRLFEAEGIMPRRLDPAEVEAYYQAHSSEYDWVRKREQLKGTPPDQIERRVLTEVRRDLQIPIRREFNEKIEAYTESLRQKARIDYLTEPPSLPAE